MLALHITLLNPSYGRSFVAAERPFLSASAPSLKSVQFGAPNRVRYVCRNITTGYEISMSVPKLRDMDAISRYILPCDSHDMGI